MPQAKIGVIGGTGLEDIEEGKFEKIRPGEYRLIGAQQNLLKWTRECTRQGAWQNIPSFLL